VNYSDPFGLLRPWGTLVLLFLAGSAAQSTIAYPLHNLLGAQPDFLLTILLCAALLSDAPTGCLLGFVGGLLSSALVGQTVGTLLVSRTIAGFMAGRFTARVFEANTLVVTLGVLVTSLAAFVIQTLAAPPRTGLALWLQATIGGAVWNAALSLPVAALLRRSGWGGPNPRLR
jgi:rod shape-determining protein MreD